MMGKLIDIQGEYALDGYDLDCFPTHYMWGIYWYEPGDYEGSGELILKIANNIYLQKDLSHCSCYGPMEDFDMSNNLTKEQILDHLCGLSNVTLHDPKSSYRGSEDYAMIEEFCKLEKIDLDQLKVDRAKSN